MSHFVEIFIGIFFIFISVLILKSKNIFFVDLSIAPKHYNRNVGQETFVVTDLISPEIAKDLMDIVFDIGQSGGFSSNVDQNRAAGFKPLHEHIGEGIPINSDGSCNHSFLFPNLDKSICVLPQRVDIGKHYIMTGGLEGVKESYGSLVDRVSSFGKYTFFEDIDKYPAVKALFSSELFVRSAEKVCPSQEESTTSTSTSSSGDGTSDVTPSYLDPFQFNFIIQVPGQTVAVHLDAPYFWGASRYHFPQWLLVCMVFSDLFYQQFVHQVQVVGYLHQWRVGQDKKVGAGGEFVFFNKQKGEEIDNKADASVSNSSSSSSSSSIHHLVTGEAIPYPLSGTLVDGSKVLHAAKVFRPDVKAPHMDKDKSSFLKYVGPDRWEVQSDGQTIASYSTDDLRIAIVYRAKCFPSQQEAHRYRTFHEDASNIMSLEGVLHTLKDDLVQHKGVSRAKLDSMSRLELAFQLMEKYIQYPLPSFKDTLIPYNYCALPLLFPWTKSIVNFICK